METSKRLEKIKKNWFFSEPLLFSVACTHIFVPNDNMNVIFRTGQKRIEYSSSLCENLSDEAIEDFLRIEMMRILLAHPYSRKPENCKPGVLLIASDITIYQALNYEKNQNFIKDYDCLSGIVYLKSLAQKFATLESPLGSKWKDTDEEKFFLKNLQLDRRTGNLVTVDNLSFEQWYKRLLFLISQISISGTSNAGSAENEFAMPSEDSTELWEENQEAEQEIQNQIKKAENEQGWGGLGGGEIRSIRDNVDFSFDYRKALTQFRQSIVSANRTLTRMRPSRRFGFKQMGSRYERKAQLLIAVDVSGSITDESFENFCHAIKNFFFLGIIEKIDLIFFDVNLKLSEPVSFRKKIDLSEIKGRGGTNFQIPVNFYEEHKSEYSGMIIFTDGEGDIPHFSGNKSNVLWILDSRIAYEKSKMWIKTLKGNKATYLPV